MRKSCFKRIAGLSLVFSLTAAALGGCQSASSGEAAGESSSQASSTEASSGLEDQTASAVSGENAEINSQAEAPDGEASSAAMGRFLESDIELPGNFDSVYDMKKLENGSIRMAASSAEGGIEVWDSGDGGETWEKQEQFQDSFPADGMPTAVGISPEGAIWVSSMKGTEADNMSLEHILAAADGTASTVDLSDSVNSENGKAYISNAVFLDNDTVILQSFTQVYQYDCTSDSISGQFPDLGTSIYGMMVVDGKVILITDSQVYVYDGNTMEEQETSEGMKENILQAAGDTSSLSTAGAKFIAGVSDESKEGGVYYLDRQGLFHQKWDGSVVEQLMDGELSSLADPATFLNAFVMLDSEHFLAAVSGGSGVKLIQYSWSKDTPAKPETELSVYSLYDNDDIRQAAAMYQKANPDVYVKMETGLTGEDGASSEDVLKTLNTEIMAGNGPDVLLLDGMNVDSYIEKGVLTDLSDLFGDKSAYYENIVGTFQGEDGSIPAVPLRFQIPLLFTTENGTLDYEALCRKTGVFNSTNAQLLLLKFWNTCGGSIQKEDGTLDEAALRSFLENMKTMKGELTDSDKEMAQMMLTGFAGSGLSTGMLTSIVSDMMNFMAGSDEGTVVGTMGSAVDFQELVSVKEEIGKGEYQAMPGTQTNVFVPTEIIGVNSKSAKADAAKEFVSYLLSGEAQSIQQGGGMPVSREAFRNTFSSLSDGGGISSSDENGNMYTLNFVLPSQEEIDKICAIADQLDTPSTMNQVLQETILEQGYSYLSGEQDLDTTVGNITQKMNLYLAE